MVQTLEHPKTVPIPRRRFTREEYYRMAELGLFRGERVELIEGDIIKMSPVSAEHVTCVHRLFQWLFQVFSDATVRIQSPLNLGDSEPEPDIAVVPGKAGDYLHAHPTTALLVVEVAQTSLEYDREVKAPLYARAGIPEYWIVNLDGQCIEVYRDPAPMGEGFGYRSRRIYMRDERIACSYKPDETLSVSDLLFSDVQR
jgi:Uma2 family endonuclease